MKVKFFIIIILVCFSKQNGNAQISTPSGTVSTTTNPTMEMLE